MSRASEPENHDNAPSEAQLNLLMKRHTQSIDGNDPKIEVGSVRSIFGILLDDIHGPLGNATACDYEASSSGFKLRGPAHSGFFKACEPKTLIQERGFDAADLAGAAFMRANQIRVGKNPDIFSYQDPKQNMWHSLRLRPICPTKSPTMHVCAYSTPVLKRRYRADL